MYAQQKDRFSNMSDVAGFRNVDEEPEDKPEPELNSEEKPEV